MNNNQVTSFKRYFLTEAVELAIPMLKEGLLINFTDLAVGTNEDGKDILTCRITVAKTAISSKHNWFATQQQ